MAGERNKWISLMIVPEDGAGVRNWRISTKRYRLLKTGIGVVGVLLLAGFVSFLAAVYLFFQVQYYRQTNDQLIEASSKLEIVSARLGEYEEKERNLRRILGGDLELPTPLTVQETSEGYQVTEATSDEGFYDLDAAIAREENRLRRIPTIWPVDAWQITKEFVYTGNSRLDHLGVDMLAYEKSPVVATANGRVTYADKSEDLGLKVTIDHENGWVTEYGHNASLLVNYGDEVKKGQTIALFGGVDDGGSGPHLHYAMFYNKKPVNPLDYLEPTIKMNVAKKNN